MVSRRGSDGLVLDNHIYVRNCQRINLKYFLKFLLIGNSFDSSQKYLF